jgi:hypothetical protein
MNRPLRESALRTYAAIPAGAAYLASSTLEKRLVQLLSRVASGERFTHRQAADFLYLPVEVFRHVWAAVLATEPTATGYPAQNST